MTQLWGFKIRRANVGSQPPRSRHRRLRAVHASWGRGAAGDMRSRPPTHMLTGALRPCLRFASSWMCHFHLKTDKWWVRATERADGLTEPGSRGTALAAWSADGPRAFAGRWVRATGRRRQIPLTRPPVPFLSCFSHVLAREALANRISLRGRFALSRLPVRPGGFSLARGLPRFAPV